MNKFRARHMALVMSIAAIAVAGCGSSSSSKTKAATTPATPSTPSTTTASSAATAYGREVQAALAPVTAEFKAVQANPSTATQGSTWLKISSTITTAKDKINGLTPPSGAQSIQTKLVSLLGAMANDSASVGNDLNKGDKTAAQNDINKFRQDALQLQAFGKQLEQAK